MHADANDEKIGEIEGLSREVPPPAGLAERVVAELRRRDLVAGRAARLSLAKRAAVVLLSLIAGFALGWLLRPAFHRETSVGAPRFMLLLFGSERMDAGGDAVREYSGWARALAASGTYVTGEKLGAWSEGVVGAPLDAEAGAKALQGFFIVEADDEEEALRLARSHPHVRRGGTIVVRRIEPT